MDNYKNKYAENADILKRDQDKLFSLSQYIPMEISSFEGLIEERMNKRVTEKENEEKAEKEKQAEKEKKEKAYNEKMSYQDEGAGFGEANLSIFKRLGKETSFLIGCALIAIIFSALYLALNSVSQNLEPVKKNKKRN